MAQPIGVIQANRVSSITGDNDRIVAGGDFYRLIVNFFQAFRLQAGYFCNWKKTNISPLIYNSNIEYWKDAKSSSHFHGKKVHLKDFFLIEWFPYSPGEYYSDEAARYRHQANEYLLHSEKTSPGKIYLPMGKNYMILGGVGSLRMAPRTIDGQLLFVLGATSSGVSHEGIPITCFEGVYSDAIEIIKSSGGVRCDLFGTLRHLSREVSGLRFASDTERYCLHLEDIKILEAAQKDEILCTAQIIYPSKYRSNGHFIEMNGYRVKLEKSWSFASFRPGVKNSLRDAVQFLQRYARNYGEDRSAIFNDFDELQGHFGNPVEFPISAVKQGAVNWPRLHEYQKALNIQNIEVVMGDKFSNISSSTIINWSAVQNALNKIGSEDKVLHDALVKVAEDLAENGDQLAIDIFENFMKEFLKSPDEKDFKKSSWDHLVNHAASVKSVVDASGAILKLFS